MLAAGSALIAVLPQPGIRPPEVASEHLRTRRRMPHHHTVPPPMTHLSEGMFWLWLLLLLLSSRRSQCDDRDGDGRAGRARVTSTGAVAALNNEPWGTRESTAHGRGATARTEARGRALAFGHVPHRDANPLLRGHLAHRWERVVLTPTAAVPSCARRRGRRGLARPFLVLSRAHQLASLGTRRLEHGLERRCRAP